MMHPAGKSPLRAGAGTLLLACLAAATPGRAAAAVVINEFMASNSVSAADNFGKFEDWIELYNTGAQPVSLAGWTLSDDEADPFQWTFPDVQIAPGGFLLVWASGRDIADAGEPLHTNFSIAAEGEELLLSRPDGGLADFHPPTIVPRDISRGRLPDGTGDWVFFMDSTPGEPNAGTGYSEFLAPPAFSVAGGFHTEPVSLEFIVPQGKQVRYTLDGSEPDESSTLYENPILIQSRAGEPNIISRIKSVGEHHYWEDPPEEVFMATVVRARSFADGAHPSPVATHTYFVEEEIADQYTLTVVSIATDNENLFDEETGIYVPGVHYDPDATTPQGSNATGNFFQRGSEWERPASFELFEEDGSRGLVQDVGIRMHGGVSRSYPRKALRLYARPLDKETDPHFDYRFFEDSPADEYSKILLRTGGQDWHYLLYRDSLTGAFLQDHTNLDFQYSRPAIVFINGEYWGIHYFRDRLDSDYLSHKYRLPADQFDMLTGRFAEVQQGGRQHYEDMYSLITTGDVTNEGTYSQISSMMDVDNFIDYNIAQIYLGNQDWPHNNIDFWRYQRGPGEPEPLEASPDDGRWRWIIYDIDASMGLSWSGEVDEPTLERATDTSSGSHHPSMLSTLLENTRFRNEFLTRLAGHLNTTFHPDTAVAAINSLHDKIAPQMPEHTERWYWPRNVSIWERDAEIVRDYARERPGHLFANAADFFELPGTFTLELAVSDSEGGSIEVGHRTLQGAAFPWDGRYFRGVPLTVRALPAPGYRFAGWQGFEEKQSAELELLSETDQSIVALFEKLDEPVLIHYWNFNETETLLGPSFTLGGAALDIAVGPDTEVTFATGQGFSGENARFGDLAEAHLRVNNPLGSVMDLAVPTTGYEQILLQYETRRSGSGAGTQIVSYTLDGSDFLPFGMIVTENEDPVVETLDFSDIPDASDNPDFGVRVEFALGDGGGVGNNRFDNITLEGFPTAGTNAPPVLDQTPGLQRAVRGQPAVYDLDEYFTDPDGDQLVYSGEIFSNAVLDQLDKPMIDPLQIEGSILTVHPTWTGEAHVTILADDGHNPPVPLSFRMLFYPEAHRLATADFNFDFWSPEQPEDTFPPSMLFLQTDLTDPPLDAPLDYSYFVRRDEYHADDQGSIGFPYALTRRTRLNALGEEGISFINTGRDRDLGGALLALDTRDVEQATLRFLAGTVLENDRLYALRLQFRTDLDAPFENFLDPIGAPIEYLRQGDGHVQPFEDIPLPEELLGHDYVQLLWRYYHVGVTSGPRAELRLDGIHLTAPREEGDIWVMY